MTNGHSSKVNEHRIQTRSEDQFTVFIHSLDWELHPPVKDYGVDYWVQVFANGNPSGDAFFVQLKGTDRIEGYYLKSRQVLRYELKIRKLKQWHLLVIPLILVVWDVVNQQGYWLHIQPAITKRLQQDPQWLDAPSDLKRTVHIPVEQLVSFGTAQEFVSAIDTLLSDFRNAKKIQEMLLQFRERFKFDIEAFLEQSMFSNTVPPQVYQQHRLAVLESKLYANSSDIGSLVEKAKIYYELHELDKALVAINSAWELNKVDTEVVWIRGCVLTEYAIANGGQPKWMLNKALEHFESLAEVATPDILHYNIGNVYAALGEHGHALEHYEMAIAEGSPGLASQIWKNKGTSNFHLGQHELEKECYQKSLELDPNRWEAYASWAITELFLGNYDEARRLFLKTEAIYPSFVTNTSLMYSFAFTCWKLELDEKALNWVNQVLQVEPNHQDARQLKSFILMTLWRQNSDYVECAANHYRLVLLDNSEDMLARSELYQILVGQDEVDEAKLVIEQLVQSDSVPTRVLHDYAVFLEHEGNLAGAISQLERACVFTHEHYIVHTLARLKQKAGDYADAIKYYQLALKDVQDSESILIKIADCYYLMGQFKNCVKIMIELILDQPDNAIFWGNLAYALAKLRQINLARRSRIFGQRVEQGRAYLSNDVVPFLEEIRVAVGLK